MNRLVRIATLTLSIGLILMIAGNASATTYYVSTSGSDSNAGTSESSPWAHLPGMQTYTGSHTPVAGDTFILRGCDDWGNSNFPITWTWSGSSGNLITVTVDKAWYNTSTCPSGWNRPIFDANSAVIAATGAECGGAIHNAFLLDSGNYNWFAWIEARNFFWAGSCANSAIAENYGQNITQDNWYVHAWSHGVSAGDNSIFVSSPGLTGDCGQNSTNNCTWQNGVIDGTDSQANDPPAGGAGIGGMNVENSVLNVMADALKTYSNGILSGNSVINIANGSAFGGTHPNCLEIVGASGTGIWYIHDNYINETQGGGCEGGQVGNPGETDFVWNNVWEMGGSSGANGPQIPQIDDPSWSMYFWNNTVNWSAGCLDEGIHGTQIKNYYFQNNHCINNIGETNDNNPTYSFHPLVPTGGSGNSNNLVMSTATAASQGYTTGNHWAPAASSNSTVGAGANLAASLQQTWAAQISGYNPSIVMASDPAAGNLACSEQIVSGVVESVCPTNTPTARGASWDVGAYQWGSTSVVNVNPPTGLVVTAQ